MDKIIWKNIWVKIEFYFKIQFFLSVFYLKNPNESYYEGHYPILVTSDIDLVQEIFVKQINNFSGRRVINLLFKTFLNQSYN